MTPYNLTLHELALTDNRRLVGDGRLFRARDSLGNLRLHDGEKFRGYVKESPRHRYAIHAWDNNDARRDVRRGGYKTRAGAERALVREGLKLVGAL